MPTVADYAVLLDESFEISEGQSFPTRPFFRPDGFVEGTDLAKAIIAFKVQPLPVVTPTVTLSPHADIIISKLSIPPETLASISLEDGILRTYWESFPAIGFGVNIGTRFSFSLSKGRARFADVILWYQVKV